MIDGSRHAEIKLATTRDKMRPGMALFLTARLYARDARLGDWQFALEIDLLYDSGLTVNDLRWLVGRGFAECGQEKTRASDVERQFRALGGLKFDGDACFVLTDAGVAFATELLQQSPVETTPTPDDPDLDAHPGLLASLPNWNSAKRELRLAGTIVKRFRVPAPNQELILSAFQEEEWPEFIDDPLPVRAEIDRRTRLHDALYRLNHNQANPLIRFHGNGKGDGIYWSLVTDGVAKNDDGERTTRSRLRGSPSKS